MLTFPEDFVWGAATSAFQIEGATRVDGRGESIWDRFAAEPGKIADGADPDVACDHYRRWPEDIELMKWLGLDAYRFSIAWPRILPLGDPTHVNPAGLDFYDRLVDGLLDAGIRPVPTLYHWDLPQALQDGGGWSSRDTAKAFVDYADVISRRLGDRVDQWITHNEPSVVAWVGNLYGEHAPGFKSWPDALATAHHLMLSHGQAVPVIRANAPTAKVGITLTINPAEPASPSEADREASRVFDGLWNRWFLDPLYGRGYPEDVINDLTQEDHLSSEVLPFVEPGDLAQMSVETDFLGVNYYTRAVLRSDVVTEDENLPRTVHRRDETSDMGWEVHPESFRRVLVDVTREYDVSCIYVTENGVAYATGPENGRVPDERRTSYFDRHLRAAHAAISEGVPLAGYFAWSLLDNFEWAHGVTKRFGIVWVDYETQQRIPKDSGHWYRRVIANGGLEES